MCKPFPPPLVRGGVFLVGLETKYRDIADGNTTPMMLATGPPCVGNQVPRYSGWKPDMDPLAAWHDPGLETKYRDVADGNDNRSVGLRGELVVLETKYRDIADST